MKTTIGKSLLSTASAAAILTAAALATPASAGDWNNGASGLKGSYASKITAVPAPAPIPDFDAKYYIGINANYTAASSGTISQEGGYVETREMSDTANFLSGGFSIGRYITPSIRAEIAFDFRPVRGIAPSESQYSRFVATEADDVSVVVTPATFGAPATLGFVASQDQHELNVTRREVTEYQYQTGMVNLYHDFKNQSRFTPFLGAGVGAVLYTFKRKAEETSECHQTFNTYTDPLRGPQSLAVQDPNGGPACRNPPETTSVTDNSTTNSWGLALAGTAGVAVDLTDSLKFDLAYRALYTSGSIEISQFTSDGGTSTVKIEDRLDHEIRLGLRWDIN